MKSVNKTPGICCISKNTENHTAISLMEATITESDYHDNLNS